MPKGKEKQRDQIYFQKVISPSIGGIKPKRKKEVSTRIKKKTIKSETEDLFDYEHYKKYRQKIKKKAKKFLKKIDPNSNFFKGSKDKFDKAAFERSEICNKLESRLRNFKFDIRESRRTPNLALRRDPITFLDERTSQEAVMSKHFIKYSDRSDNDAKKYRGEHKTIKDAKVSVLKKLDDEGILTSDNIPCIYCSKLVSIFSIDLDHVQPKHSLYKRMAAIIYLINKAWILEEAVLKNKNLTFDHCIIEATVPKPDNKRRKIKTFGKSKSKQVYYPSQIFKRKMFNERRNLLPSCKKCNQSSKKAYTLDEFIESIQRKPHDPFYTATSQFPGFDHNGLFSLMPDGTTLAGQWFLQLYIEMQKGESEKNAVKVRVFNKLAQGDYTPEQLREIEKMLDTMDLENKTGPSTSAPGTSKRPK